MKKNKLFLAVYNPLRALLTRILQIKHKAPLGCLPTVDDDRDHEAQLGFGSYTPKQENVSHYLYEYTQRNNICTAASAAKALSEQLGLEVSCKPLMRKMVKDGQVSGNGFSHQRAPLNVFHKDGIIFKYQMPDEDGDWDSFKKWDSETEHLYSSGLLKIGEYKQLTSESAVLEAIDQGYVPVIATEWFSNMNWPQPIKYFLDFVGSLIGGHAYRITGYRLYGADFEVGQTFGKQYGDSGRAYLRELFGKSFYKIFIMDFDGKPAPAPEVLLPYFLAENEGKMVKSKESVKCYVILNGKKRHVSGDDQMKTFFHLQSTVGLKVVKQELLDAVTEGEQYPFI